jgi:NADH pyrophosphatase NudC (nudix superfamily)
MEVVRQDISVERYPLETTARTTERRMNMGHYLSEMHAEDDLVGARKQSDATTRKDRTVEEVAISKTETTSCEWCDSGIDTASVMSADMMMRFVRPVNFCPNCGRKLKGE